MALLVGTAGVPISARERSSISGINRIAELGLNCMELEFVRGVRMSPEMAREVGKAAKENKICLTVHGPYYINLNSAEKKKIEASKKRIIDSARIGNLAGAQSVTFHPAYYGGKKPEEVYQIVKRNLKEVLDKLKKEKNSIRISPELTGKASAFGNLEELVRLAKELHIGICIDWAHLHARTGGKYNSFEDWDRVLKFVKKEIGLDNLHMHISGINYSEKGEKNHLNLKNSDLKYKELCKALAKNKVNGWIISESPNLEGDALLIKKELA